MSRYQVGDRVQGPVFWMTVVEVLPHGLLNEPARYRCVYGADHDAGIWRESELTPYEAPLPVVPVPHEPFVNHAEDAERRMDQYVAQREADAP